MKRLFCLLAFFLPLLHPVGARAQEAKLGDLVVRFPFGSPKVLADPARDRFYAVSPGDDRLVVINTLNLKVLAAIRVTAAPAGLALSADNDRLYVAGGNAMTGGVSVIGLNSLAVQRTLSLPGRAVAVVEGLDNRLYVSVGDSAPLVYQIDGQTGTVQATFGGRTDANLLAITPDRKTVFTADTGASPGSLSRFDVSASDAVLLQTKAEASDSAQQLVVSRTGKYVCLPGGGGTPNTGGFDQTALFSTADISRYFGVLAVGSFPGPLAFTADDSLVYHTTAKPGIEVFDAKTDRKLDAVSLPGGGFAFTDAALDRTGSYLAVGQDFAEGLAGLTIFATGRGTLEPSSLLPVFVGLAPNQNNLLSSFYGVPFVYQLTATNAPATFQATNLPPGLGIDQNTGVISGTPTAEFSDFLVVTAINASGSVSTGIDLELSGHGNPTAPSFSATPLPLAVLTRPYRTQAVASNAPGSFTAAGLPAGLSIDPATGVISGIPGTSGAYAVLLTAKNVQGNGQATLSLIVGEAPADLPVVSAVATTPRVTAGSGEAAVVTLTRTGDLSKKITVRYSLKGSAKNGVDYAFLSGKLKIKSSRDSGTISIVPIRETGTTKKIELTLLPGTAYQPDVNPARVKILPRVGK